MADKGGRKVFQPTVYLNKQQSAAEPATGRRQAGYTPTLASVRPVSFPTENAQKPTYVLVLLSINANVQFRYSTRGHRITSHFFLRLNLFFTCNRALRLELFF